MDTAAAIGRWIEGWTRGWSVHDVETISALYAPDALFVSHPFREPQDPRAYVERAFADEERGRDPFRRAGRRRRLRQRRILGLDPLRRH